MFALVAIVASYPKWAGGWVKEELETRLSKRLESEVIIEDLELDYTEIRLRGITLSQPALRVDEMVVTLADNPLWSLRASVDHVEIIGGYLEGDRQAVEALAAKLRRKKGEDEGEGGGWLRRRVKARPRRVAVDGFAFELSAATGPVSRVKGVVEGEADLYEGVADLVLHQSAAHLRALGDKRFAARRLHTKLNLTPDGLQMPLRIDLEGGATAITKDIAVAQVDGWIELEDRAASRISLDLTGGFGAGEAGRGGDARLWSITGSGRRDLSEGKLVVAMEPFELGRVPEVLEQVPGLVDSERATVSGELAMALSGGTARLDGSVDLAGLNLDHPLLARDTLEDLDLRVDLGATVDPEAYTVEIRELILSRRGAKVAIRGKLVHPPEREQRKYQLYVKVPKTECATILAAIPRAFVPSLQGLRVRGIYEAEAHLEVDFAALDDLELATSLRPRNCKVEGVPPALSPARLRNGFTHRVTMRDGRHRMVRLFSGSSSYASLSSISEHMVSAVLTTEDAAFWRHSGFLPRQFGEALRRNLKAGRVRLGASTITMQMVKNVFLSHERTLSRKFQELVLTEYVERTLPKARIMELYLNVIEFAPGVYGVRQASEHYFGKHPRELTSLEAAYLSLMLPSPVRRHAYFCRGQLTDSFDRKLRMIHKLMWTRGHITEQEYLLWKDAPLVFDPLRVVNQSSCLAEIEHLLSATEGQRAVTGLMRGEGPDRDEIDEDEEDTPDMDEDLRREIEDDIEMEAREPEPAERPMPLPDLLPGGDPEMSDAPGIPAMDQL